MIANDVAGGGGYVVRTSHQVTAVGIFHQLGPHLPVEQQLFSLLRSVISNVRQNHTGGEKTGRGIL
eukprot:764413-Hanusia_phi.AAC.3